MTIVYILWFLISLFFVGACLFAYEVGRQVGAHEALQKVREYNRDREVI
jgi:hypothetical protein